MKEEKVFLLLMKTNGPLAKAVWKGFSNNGDLIEIINHVSRFLRVEWKRKLVSFVEDDGSGDFVPSENRGVFRMGESLEKTILNLAEAMAYVLLFQNKGRAFVFNEMFAFVFEGSYASKKECAANAAQDTARYVAYVVLKEKYGSVFADNSLAHDDPIKRFLK